MKNNIILLSLLLTNQSMAASPTMDSFHVQSFLKLSNNSPVNATSADFVFAVFKGSSCIWAKRYSAVAINSGVMNQKISGTGTNVTSINNASHTPGECISNFSGTTLDATLLNTGSPAALSIRIYTETTIDTYKPIWDIPLNSAPTAFVAENANNATTAGTANDLAAGAKVTISSGAADVGKFPVLNASGQLDNSMINAGALTIANTQVSGLGTASTVNTGTTSGTIPVLGAGGRLGTAQMPTYTANRVMSTDGTGAMSGSLSTTSTSSGAADSGKIAILNGSGVIDNTMIDSTQITPSASNISGTLSVNKGGTGSATLTNGSLIVGAGTGAVTTLAPGTTGNILYGSSPSTWVATTPDTAGLVDTTSAQTIAGNKTLSNNLVVNGTADLNSTTNISGTTTISGSTTLSNNVTLSGSAINIGNSATSAVTIANNATATFALGSGGTVLKKVVNCTIASATLSAVTTRTGACTGVTTSTPIFCAPAVAPPASTSANHWVTTAYPTANNVNVYVVKVGTATNWTTSFNCTAFIP